MKTVERYQADDGQEFRTAEECTLYERDKDAHALVGISLATMTAILDGAHGTEDLSLALERVGTRRRLERQKRGDKLRGASRDASSETRVLPPPYNDDERTDDAA